LCFVLRWIAVGFGGVVALGYYAGGLRLVFDGFGGVVWFVLLGVVNVD